MRPALGTADQFAPIDPAGWLTAAAELLSGARGLEGAPTSVRGRQDHADTIAPAGLFAQFDLTLQLPRWLRVLPSLALTSQLSRTALLPPRNRR